MHADNYQRKPVTKEKIIEQQIDGGEQRREAILRLRDGGKWLGSSFPSPNLMWLFFCFVLSLFLFFPNLGHLWDCLLLFFGKTPPKLVFSYS